MTRDEVSKKIKDIIAKHFTVEVDSFDETTELIAGFGADSLDSVELIINAEDAFEIEISDDDAETLTTVGDMIDLVVKLSAANTQN